MAKYECFYCGEIIELTPYQLMMLSEDNPAQCPKCKDTRLRPLHIGDYYGYDEDRDRE